MSETKGHSCPDIYGPPHCPECRAKRAQLDEYLSEPKHTTLAAENERLRAALRAISARINGEWGQADLMAVGELGTVPFDCERIARTALYAKGNK